MCLRVSLLPLETAGYTFGVPNCGTLSRSSTGVFGTILQPKTPVKHETAIFFSYARIIPMHLTIIAGGALLQGRDSTLAVRLTMLLFMSLKTAADLVIHLVKRRGFADLPRTKNKPASSQ